MATFVVYEKALELAFQLLDRSTLSDAAYTGVNLGSGLVAGMAAAVVSQPADTMLSKINQIPARSNEGTAARLYRIAMGLGIRGSFAGLPARLIMVSGMTAGQFTIYGNIKKVGVLSSCIQV